MVLTLLYTIGIKPETIEKLSGLLSGNSDNDLEWYLFFWNVLLALIPIFLAARMIRYYRAGKLKGLLRKFGFGAVFFVWLLFLPNTAYIIMDIRHITPYCPANNPTLVCPESLWIVALFFAYSLIGWVSFVYAVRQMRTLVCDIHRERTARLFTAIIIPLVSLGVMIGLIDRLNSWDFFLNPVEVLRVIWQYFSVPLSIANWLIYTFLFALLYWAGTRLFRFSKMK